MLQEVEHLKTTPTWSSFYTRKPKRRSSNPFISPPLRFSIFLFPGQVTNCSPRIKPPFNYPFIERYSSLSNPQRDSSFAVGNRRFPLTSTQQGVRGSMSQCDVDSDSGPFEYVSCILFRPNGRIFHSSTSPFIPRILGCAASFPLRVCILWDQPSSELVLFYYPFPPSRFLTPILCVFGLSSRAGVVFTYRSSCT